MATQVEFFGQGGYLMRNADPAREVTARSRADREDAESTAAEGRRRRDAALAQVEDANKNTEWFRAAKRALQGLAASGAEFNADDVRALVGAPPEAGAMGALFGRAVRSGALERVSMRRMASPQSHARATSVYRGRR